MPFRVTITAFIIISALVITAPVASHSEETKSPTIKYARGRIYSIDYTNSKITIQWLYTTGKISQATITFIVPRNTDILTQRDTIFRKLRHIGVVDLIIGDHIIIKYYDDKKTTLPQAVSITVLDPDTPTTP